MGFRSLYCIGASVCALAAGTASGQEAADTQAQAGYGEIIVTAQKRAQRLNDVGITIVAATGQQLENAGVRDVVDLPRISPGLTTATTYSGFPVYSLRGINFNSAQIATPSAVSLYVDEAAIPYATQSAGLLFDMERVEVLKGPQGTLFGQNSTGGSINVIAAKPTSTLSGGFTQEINNFGQVSLEGFVSGPLSDTVRVRLAGTTTQFGAWQQGYFANRQKNGDQNRGAARLLVDWDAGERLKVSLNVTGTFDHGESQQGQLALVAPATPAAAVPGLIGYPYPKSNRDADFNTGYDTRQRNRQFMAVLRGDYEIADDVTLTSLTDYIDTKIHQPRDFDGTALDLTGGLTGGTIKSFVQELRLSGRLPDAGINYVLGFNYQKDKIFDFVQEDFNGFSSFPVGSVLQQPYHLTNRAVGAFGNIDFAFTSSLTLTAGVRYTDTKQTVDGCVTGNAALASSIGFLAGLVNPAAPASYVAGGCLTIGDQGASPTFLPTPSLLQQKEDNWSWRVGLNFKPNPDTLVYALASRGYKAGTFPLTVILFDSLMRDLKQEELTSYEVGTKLSLMDRKVQLNLSAFFYDYRDKQFYTYVPIPLVGVSATFVNIPRSKVKGLDAEVVINPVKPLTLRGGLTYIRTRIGAFSGFNSLAEPTDFQGKEFNFAPPWSLTFDAQYDVPVSDALKAYVGIGGLYNNRTYSDLGETPTTKVAARTVLDARIGVESDDGWRVQAWVRNLTDATYWNSLGYSGDTLVRFAGMPRTFGATFGFNF